LGLVRFIDGYDLTTTGSLLVPAKHPPPLSLADICFIAIASRLMLCVGDLITSAIWDHWSRPPFC
jgi:hypothetical protein